MDVLSTFPVCMKIAPVYYWQVVYPEFYAVFLGFRWLGLRITFFRVFCLLCFRYWSLSNSHLLCSFHHFCVDLSNFFLATSIVSDDANNVLGVRLSYLLRSVPGRESAFFCSTGIHVSELLFHLHIISMILRVAPQWQKFSLTFANFEQFSSMLPMNNLNLAC